VDVQLPEIVQAGIDTISFYLPLEGSPAIEKISKLPGRTVRYGGTMLGEYTTWGDWAHWFGYTATWWPRTKRLSLFPKLVLAGELCPIGEFEERVQGVIERLAAIGVVSYLKPYVTRIDVAADGRFSCQRTAKNFLQAVYGSRAPNGGRTEAVGDPIGTVYLLTRTGKDKAGRVYDKGREMRERARRDERDGLPEPYTVIRVESVHRYKAENLPLDAVALIARELWRRRFMPLIPEPERAMVIPFDQLRARIVQSVRAGELKPSQGERLRLFLELEATGEAESYYGPKQFAQRRREARRHGLRVEDCSRESADFEIAALLRAYDEATAWGEEAAPV
jgi:hypothetical protein